MRFVFTKKSTRPQQQERPAQAHWPEQRSLREQEVPRSLAWARPHWAVWPPSPEQRSWTPGQTGWPPALLAKRFSRKDLVLFSVDGSYLALQLGVLSPQLTNGNLVLASSTNRGLQVVEGIIRLLRLLNLPQ